MKKQTKIILGAVVALLIIALGVVFLLNRPSASKGAKSVTIEVMDNNGTETSYSTNTDAEYLSEVFDEIDDLTVEGDVTDYGLYINTVNGVTADYSVDASYWAIYVNGEYGQYGADQQVVNDGDVFRLEYTVYAE